MNDEPTGAAGDHEATPQIEDFTLLGGPLKALERRIGLVRGTTDPVKLGLWIGVSLWGVTTVLSLVGGHAQQLFSLAAIGVHARLLVVIPLLFLGEAWLDPRMATFVGTIVRSQVVPAAMLPRLKREIAGVRRMNDSWLPDIVCLVVVLLMSVLGSRLPVAGLTAAIEPGSTATGTALANNWYWYVCLPVFRFLLVRWIWRVGVWSFFLWRLGRLELRLVPVHPDRAGGLGYLDVVHGHFIPLVLAHSIVQAASFAEEISSGRMTLEATYPALALILVADAALFLGPPLLLMPRLWACRVKGLRDYMELANRYVSDFDRKWLGANPPAESLLGTADLQSLADLSNSVNVVRNMRLMPIEVRTLYALAVAAVLPMLPLLLLKYPIAELAQRLFARLSSL